jgi:hypothetical protein
MGVPQQLRNRTDRRLSESGAVADPPTNDSEGQLEITVVFTTPEATISATKRAAAFLHGLNARINLVAAQPVPFPLGLDNPPVSLAFNELQLLRIAMTSSVEMNVKLYLCRSRVETLISVLKPGSVLIVGVRKKWLPTWERKLTRKLKSAGFRTLLLDFSSPRSRDQIRESSRGRLQEELFMARGYRFD